VDSIIQDFIDVRESNYEEISDGIDAADDGLVYMRNTTWTVIAGVLAVATGLTQLGLFALDFLISMLIVLVTVGIGVTIGVAYSRKQIVSRLEKVEEQYDEAKSVVLTMQNWFHNETIYPSRISQKTLDLYNEFVIVGVAASNVPVLDAVRTVLIELRQMKPKDPLPLPWQRLSELLEQRYEQFKARRSELMNPEMFSQVAFILSPFENRYQRELGASKT
jgi:uncharacterized membrane protein